MAYVVIDNCQRCKYTDCVAVCPVDCFWDAGSQLVIDPEECIDCGACVPECPVEAIYAEEDLEPGQEHWLAFNRAQAEASEVNITETQEALPTAEDRRRELGFG